MTVEDLIKGLFRFTPHLSTMCSCHTVLVAVPIVDSDIVDNGRWDGETPSKGLRAKGFCEDGEPSRSLNTHIHRDCFDNLI